MNYYENILNQIEKLINESNFDEASKLILDELNAPYVPKDVLDKLIELKDKLPYKETNNALDDEKIIEYLSLSPEKQLIAVEELNKRNLRDYIDICNDYLKNDGFINAKVLLIYSLIEQEISLDITYINEGVEYNFIPKYCLLPSESLGFIKAKKIIEDRFLKDPSMLEMAKSLLYKECLIILPISYGEDEAQDLASRIIDYVIKAFNC